MGLIVNKPAPELSFVDLLAQLEIPATVDLRRRGCISAGRSSMAAASCCTAPDYSVAEAS